MTKEEVIDKILNVEDELYSKLVCALTHDISTCGACKQCAGQNSMQIRLNLVNNLAKYMGRELPWKENKWN